jgi:hypothetical protein
LTGGIDSVTLKASAQQQKQINRVRDCLQNGRESLPGIHLAEEQYFRQIDPASK